MANGYWLLAIGYWLLANGYWLMAIGYWLLAAAVSGVATYEGRGVGTARVACADVYCVRPCERDRHGRNAVFQEAGGETGLPVQRLCLRFPEHTLWWGCPSEDQNRC